MGRVQVPFEKKTQAKGLLQTGMSQRRIAKTMGVSQKYVFGVAKNVSVSLWECPKLLANVGNVSRKTVRREMSWSAQARDSSTERAYRSLVFVRPIGVIGDRRPSLF